MRLANRIAIITGGSRGIGRAVALAFAHEGAKVAVVSRNKARCDEVVVQISKNGGDAISIQADVSSEADVTKMVEQLGFPHALIAIEKELSHLPHLAGIEKKQIPKRRADVLCFAKDIHKDFPLYPLLMIECKVSRITSAHLRQVIGYNESVKAFYIAVACTYQILRGTYNIETKTYEFEEGLPQYLELLAGLGKMPK